VRAIMACMVVLGVVLLVIVVVFAVAVGVSNPGVLNLYVFNALVPVTLPGVFFTGAGALLVVLIAGLLIQRGLARSAKLRRQQRALAGSPSTGPAAPPPTTSRAAAETDSAPRRAAGAHAVEPAASEPGPADPQVTPPSPPVTTVTADPGPVRTSTVPTASSLNLDPEPKANAPERAALLAEADESTRDEPLR